MGLGLLSLSDFLTSEERTPYSRENYAEILKNDNMHRTGKMNNGGV